MLKRYLLSAPEADKKESGFSLVEILVVIVIIGLLAAIAIPIFMNQRKKANDATLISDVRNAATVVASSNLTPDEFREVFDAYGVNAEGEGAVHQLSNPVRWNDNVPDVDPMTVSDGAILAVFMYRVDAGTWNAHQEGEFCIGGVHANSNYDYIPGAGATLGAGEYDRYIYFDVKQGGIKTMDELVAAYEEDPDSVSCSGHVYSYINAS